ncbi:MAG: hypothetical protein ACLUE2_15315 [Bacteroides cellulosilyticus]
MKQDSLSANFSITCWIKPEVDIAMTEEQELGDMRARFFAIYPLEGERRHGKGHSSLGLSVGRNGVVVYERTIHNKAVYRNPRPLSGWTHFALVYQDNTPHLWINGVYAGAGTTSDTIVHLEISHSDLLCKADAYEGGLCNLCIHPSSIDKTEITNLYQRDTCSVSSK